MKTTPKRSTRPKAFPFVVSIRFGTLTLKGKGATILAALSSIEKPVKITEKTFITVTKGDKVANRMLMPMQAKRLFYPLAQAYMAKQLEHLLK